MKLINILSVLAVGALMASCENLTVTFPDYEGGTSVYFAYQYPVRTLILGNSTTTPVDNDRKCIIYGAMGGAYKGKDITVDVKVDNTLTDNLYFPDGSVVQPMPAEYYTLGSDKLIYGGDYMGGVEVQFTDAFFADPKALKNTYVIPLMMTGVKGADRILAGTPLIEGDKPAHTNSEYWSVQPKDYVLYCVKFINPWHATYLRRGVDVITENGKTTTVVRHTGDVEKNEVCKMTTSGLKQTLYPVTTTVASTQAKLACDLLLTFNDKNECVITSATAGYTASGSGKFVEAGEKKSFGNKDRDVMYLEYNIDFGAQKYATKDTLVVQTRGVVAEWFTPTYKAN